VNAFGKAPVHRQAFVGRPKRMIRVFTQNWTVHLAPAIFPGTLTADDGCKWLAHPKAGGTMTGGFGDSLHCR
jgi:hypothetical protein